MADFSLDALRELLRSKLGTGRYSDQIDRSVRLAFDGHREQFRDHLDLAAGKIPYIVHPVGAALLAIELLPLVQLPDKLDDIISACLTHDLLEDSNVSISTLEKASSKRVADIVVSLTKPTVDLSGSHGERSKRFVQQIVNAGPTAMFVKMCDYLHNISRPRQTPTKLLDKAIRRGKFEYARFFDEGHFGDELRDVFFGRITQAEVERASLRQASSPGDRGVSTFEEAIALSFSLARKKLLEIHDVVDALDRIVDPISCNYERLEDYVARNLKDTKIPSGERSAIIKSLRDGHLDIASHKGLRQSDQFTDVADVFVIQLHLGAFGEDERRMILSLRSNRTWINHDSLSAVVLVLSERLRIQVNRRASEVSLELKHIGLELNPSIAIRSNMTFEQYLALKSLIDASTVVHDILRSSVSQAVLSNPGDLEIERIESRIKSADSIVEKLISRRYKNIHEMDDVVGMRIICLSPEESESIVTRILNSMQLQGSVSLLTSMLDGAINTENVVSSVGYKAIHMRFALAVPFQSLQLVRCEIQVRTIFQDAWARASQIALYKKERNRAKNARLFDELSELCSTADRLLERL